jgi:hypothetical protein
MRQRREIAARSYASLLRNRRAQSSVEHRQQQLGEIGTRTGVSFGDDVRAKKHHCAHFALGEQIPNACRMASNEIDLELGETIRRYRDLGQFSESRRDAVRDLLPAHDVVNNPSRHCDALSSMWCEGNDGSVAGDGSNLLECERISVDDDIIGHSRECQRGTPTIQGAPRDENRSS